MSGRNTAQPSKSSAPRSARGSASRHARKWSASATPLAIAQEALGLVTWIWDARRDKLRWYGDPSLLLGLAPGTFVGRFRDYLEYVHPQDRPQTWQTFLDCLKGIHAAYRAEERVVWPDGSLHWLETYGRARYGRDGRAIEVCGAVRDCTERKRSEAALEQSEKKFTDVFRALNAPVVISRQRDGVIVDVNDAWVKVNGLAREQVIGRPGQSAGHWSDLEARRRIVAEVQATGRADDQLVRFIGPSGAERQVLVSCTRLDIDGEPHLLWNSRDVTKIHEREHELAISEERSRQLLRKFTTLFETAPIGILLTRPGDRRILEINDAALRLVGLTRDEALQATTLDIFHWENPEQRERARARVLAGERVINDSITLTRRDGKRLETLMSGSAIEIDGDARLLITMQDVTDLRRTEDNARQALGRFSAVFTHSPDPIAISRIRDRQILAVNDAWVRANGYSREQVVGRTSEDIGVWTDSERGRLIEDLKAQGSVQSRLLTFRRADGSERQSLISATIIEIDGEECVILMGRDVTEQRRAEEELRSNRRLLEMVIDAIPMSIFAKDVNSNYIMLNKRMAEFFGVPKEELLRRHTSRLPISSESRVKSLGDDEWVFKNRRTLDQPDTLLAHPDGSLVHYHSTKIPLFDELGELIGLLGVNRDISEEKRAQSALRESENRYRSLFQAAMDCILVIAPDGTLLDINDYGCRSLGYTREQLRGGSFDRILDASGLRRLLPRPGGVAVERRSVRAEQEILAKDGGVRAVEFSAGPLPDGNVLVIVRDVSERKRNEKLLGAIARGVSGQIGESFFISLVTHLCRELDADFALVGELLPGGDDRVRTIAFCKDGQSAPNFEYSLAGTPCANAFAERATIVYPARARELFPQDKELGEMGIEGYVGTSLLDSRGQAIGLLTVMTRQPIVRHALWVSVLEIYAARAAAEIERARAEAEVRELNASLERRVAERTAALEAANRELDSYSYTVSHDLRAPLRAIAGFSGILREEHAGDLSGEALRLLQRVEGNAERMAELIDDLLRFSRTGRAPLSRNSVGMRALVEEVVRDLAPAGDARTQIAIGALPDAFGDASLLRQVWQNLIGNALKFSRGVPQSRIRIGSSRAAGGVEYFVSDNGSGFDMRYAGKLFGVFQRLHPASEFEGTGVGLAIVQRIVQRHGGAVAAEGEPGGGATFRFTLPDA